MSEAKNEPEDVLERIRKRDFPGIPAQLVRDVLEVQRSSTDTSAVARKMTEVLNRHAAEDT